MPDSLLLHWAMPGDAIAAPITLIFVAAVPTDILHFLARVVVTPTDGPYVLERLSGLKERPASGR